MHIRLLAVGDRQPAWVDDAFDNYAARLPRDWRFRLDALRTAKRAKGASPKRAIDDEEKRLLAKLSDDEQVVLLDERGRSMDSQALSRQLSAWQADGRSPTFIIGGPDGVSDAVRARADYCWSLSELTLPHGLARVILAEQLYRAWSLQSGHPYHRN